MSEQPGPAPAEERVPSESDQEHPGPMVSRREFLIGAGAGAAVAATAAGAATILRPAGPTIQPGASPAGQPGAAGTAPPPLSAAQRLVRLDIDGKPYEVTVDVRESLWQTITYKLGLGGVNLGCDRAQCGACAITVDGRAVNGCTVMTARLGRGQKILTVDGIRPGPGIEGLHPIQRAFWEQGGFQCGICTRGFIMSAYALLQVNQSPNRAQIREALAGNICRCSEYPKMYDAVERAAADLRANPLGARRGVGGGLVGDGAIDNRQALE